MEITDVSFSIEGYNSVSVCRNLRKEGGLKLFNDERLNVQTLHTFTGVEGSTGSYETLFVKAIVPGVVNLSVGGIYRPRNRSNVEFLSYIVSILQNYGDNRTVFMGDFSYNVMKVKDNTVSNYQNVPSRYNFVNGISLQTYSSPGTFSSTSCLDHIWHNLIWNR